MDSGKKTRRDFLNYIFSVGLFGWLGSVLYPLYSFVSSSKLKIDDISYINLGVNNEMEINSSKLFKINKKPAILIKTKDGELKALSAVCTHLQCTVQFNKEENALRCPCHFGKYDLSGKNVSGPPPNPLTQYEVFVKNDIILVRK
ncbi:MAG: Rieske (2Fe-2S) protein [Ignavibacteria bacterium]|nr:Rieske (2Fe-2S) protein [Ignavibacteria bacterium]